MTDDFKSPMAGDPEHLREAFELEGLKEIVGGRHEGRVLAFFADAGHSWVKDDETAWCAAFVHAMLGRAGITGTGSLAARSYVGWEVSTTKPRRGDVVVFKRGTSKWQGHVAFFLKAVGERIWVLGGNQGNAVSVASYPKTSLLGYRKVPSSARESLPSPSGEEVEGPVPTEPSPTPIAAPAGDVVRRVQEQLKALGYSEAGKVDGILGPMTEAAILAFRKDNGLPLSTAIDDELHAALGKAQPRRMSVERTEATPAEVRQEVPEAKATWFGQVWASIIGVFAGLWALIKGVFADLGLARDQVQPLIDVLGDIPGWVYALIVVGMAVTLFLQSRRGTQHIVEAYQSGERR